MSTDSIILELLVIDDHLQSLELVREGLAQDRLRIHTASEPGAGWELFLRLRPKIVLLDLVMPGMNGLELLEKMVAADPQVEVILISGQYSTEAAVEAIKKGACDYMTKPLALQKLRDRIGQLMREEEQRRRASQLERELLTNYQFEGIVGRSPQMLEVFAKVRRIAPHFRTVLLTGDTGTGKELVARALHKASPVASRAFAVCNCAAIVETLLESELFGYARGAFTGATQDKMGLFEYASGGTLLLDEIGEMPLAAQAKLLRVLECQEIQRVGSPSVRKVDVHVVAATNRNLRALAAEGKFRQDLYYRLSMVEITLPRLTERKEDLPLLQRHFLEKFAAQYNKPLRGLSRRAQALLTAYHWPGNVRELENVLGSASMTAEGEFIDVGDLPSYIVKPTGEPRSDETLLSMEELQQQHLRRVLEEVGGNKNLAAQVLGISRATLYNMLGRMDGQQRKRQGTDG